MKQQIVLILCWIVMLGNCLISVFTPVLLIGFEIDQSQNSAKIKLGIDVILGLLPFFVLVIMSFYCAFVLRKMIMRAIQSEKANSRGST